MDKGETDKHNGINKDKPPDPQNDVTISMEGVGSSNNKQEVDGIGEQEQESNKPGELMIPPTGEE